MILGYFIGYIACTTRSQILGFSIPLLLATPVSVGILAVQESCRFYLLLPGNEENCIVTHTDIKYLIFATLFFVLANVCTTWKFLFKDKFNIMLRENQLFWTPMYNSALLEHWMMLGRRNTLMQPHENAENSKLFICTTMYREDKNEMKQLLQSFKSVNDKVLGARGLEVKFHIYFDDAIKEGQETKYVQQLFDALDEVFVTSRDTSMKTHYGMLTGAKENFRALKIHLKDNSKVKSKKRWSQVMYMKHILKETVQSHQNSYILTTDADVKFTPESVEALLDLMIRDEKVGAVCARTHPLGSGLLVWYQVFEYAIGHWLLKVSEHVLGTVLCAPGCFTVYRCSALNDVLNLYATDIEEAGEFLTKNMGEDRWLCTLLVQKGWRIEYCATAKDYTHCPESFDEYFKQRRRWIVSTMANQWLLIKEWSNGKTDKLHVPFLFMVYQIVLLFSTVIGPSSIILVLSGGLKYGKDWSSTVTIPIQIIACICYAIVCILFPQKIQLMVGRLLCCLYTIFMGIAIVGTVVGISTDINGVSGAEENFISENMKMSSTSVYLIGMAIIFFVTALLHLTEFWAIFYGIIYLLGLPTGYLILMIYSICNITDTSWGTREDSYGISFRECLRSAFNFICFKSAQAGNYAQTGNSTQTGISAQTGDSKQTGDSTETSDSAKTDSSIHSIDFPRTGDSIQSSSHLTQRFEFSQDRPNEAQKFKENGYEKTSFISGISKEDLGRIGINEEEFLENIEEEVDSPKKYEIPMIIPAFGPQWSSFDQKFYEFTEDL
ncbi:chitin synthase chs-2-like [Ruditapes philippinarum]|uniref:chitin synthase chs-2-like n=1 Tax=Ruditapes philippinarum TaxID=129788 RepID=UPI00295B6D47|nr:chitin synthase chs-2-like [Ruditapes philippinarum]